MKRIFIIAFVMIGAFQTSAYSQITVTQAAEKKVVEEVVVPYDSTKNFLGKENVTSYIGQLLYVKSLGGVSIDYGYGYFHTKKEASSYSSKERYGNPAKKSDSNTLHEDLAGKYFKVVDVQKDSRAKSDRIYQYTYWFKLQNRDNPNDVAWFEYRGDSEASFPFVTVSFFNYLKSNIGKKYISSYTISEGKVNAQLFANDINTGEAINHSKDDVWECTDVTITGTYPQLVLLVKNQNNDVSAIIVNNLKPKNGHYLIFEEEYFRSLEKKYGKDIMDMVRQQKIKVGMPLELLIMSWGEPEKINRSSSGTDQYVYDNQYVYVADGKISAWNSN